VLAGLIPIFPAEKKFSVKPKTQASTCITHRQLSIIPSYAFTDFKSQGQTIDYAVVDLRKPPAGGLMPFSTYVALSRSKGWQSIRLLQDFNNGLFMNHPLEDLRNEDEKLEALDMTTVAKYEMGAYG